MASGAWERERARFVLLLLLTPPSFPSLSPSQATITNGIGTEFQPHCPHSTDYSLPIERDADEEESERESPASAAAQNVAVARSDRGAREHQLGPPRDAPVRGEQWHQVDHAPQGQLHGGGCVVFSRPPRRKKLFLLPPVPPPPNEGSIGAMARASGRTRMPAALPRIERGAHPDDRRAIRRAAPLSSPLLSLTTTPQTPAPPLLNDKPQSKCRRTSPRTSPCAAS